MYCDGFNVTWCHLSGFKISFAGRVAEKTKICQGKTGECRKSCCGL